MNNKIKNLQEKVYEIVAKNTKTIKDVDGTRRKEVNLSELYDWVMLVMIFASVVPLMFRTSHPIFKIIEIVTVISFIIDYLLRWFTAPQKFRHDHHKNNHMDKHPYLVYPFTNMAIVDLLSILPGLGLISQEFKLLRFTRLLKIVRLLKLTRYTNKITIFVDALEQCSHVLLSVLVLTVFYIFLSALIMYNAEPAINPITGEETFHTFFDAIYWSTVTLTTVGYGDVCPVSDIGRLVAMFSAILGVVLIALPSGVITAAYLDLLRKRDEEETAEG